MTAITTTARVNLTAYDYNELSAEAQRFVFEVWKGTDRRACLYDFDRDDINAALESFCDIVDVRRPNAFPYIFDDVDFFEAIEMPTSVDEYAGCGLWCGYDIARAFNAHTAELDRLRNVCFEDSDRMNDEAGEFIYTVMENQDAYADEYNAALRDVAQTVRDLLNQSEDWYFSDSNAADIWADCEREAYTDGRWYDADGRDVTELVDRYGAVVIDDDAA